MTPLELRDQVIWARQAWGRGEIGLDELYRAADVYIESLKAYKRKTGKRLGIPSRHQVIRMT
jgi:hypothetical protein